jgi:hypothetical protein
LLTCIRATQLVSSDATLRLLRQSSFAARRPLLSSVVVPAGNDGAAVRTCGAWPASAAGS